MDVVTPGAVIDREEQIARRAAADAHILHCYRTLLHREPGTAERESWVAAMLRGLTPHAVTAAFRRSDEYRALQRDADTVRRIAGSGLFDPEWYAERNPDVVAAGMDPLAHYCRHGRREHRAPNPYFLPRWYAERTALDAESDPLLHYAESGEAAGLPPCPDFAPDWYRDTYALGPGDSALAHFLRHRGEGRYAPSPRLWAIAQQRWPAEGTDPFLPWLGPPDLFAGVAPDVAALADTGLFDANFYQIVNSDVFESGLEPLVHFCAFGWKEGRNPSFYFNTGWYLATNPDLRRLRVNPLVHYLLVGEPADRRPVVWFEPGWYRQANAIPSGTSPLGHFLKHRHSGGVSPNSLFDPDWYRAHCGQKLHPRRDAFAHYLVAGTQADLQPSPWFDAVGWRARRRGRRSRHFRDALVPERDNPLVDYLLAHYR
jgi:hypothetical protein